ncbi:UNVERIFIED_CONTAM: hypothetical protein Sangu_2197700 [Sesamum angustifolium]|uniref:DUF4283 domain-containing protein n=1 Tax=Sesamum angustifolium TaxID=2727405 RepID=A0AAW2LFI6_9LAMI
MAEHHQAARAPMENPPPGSNSIDGGSKGKGASAPNSAELARVNSTEPNQSVPETVQPKHHDPPNNPVPPQHTRRSFAEVASHLPRQNYHTFSPEDLRKSYLADVQPKPLGHKSLIEGQPILSFNEDETNTLAAHFRFALVGKFSHGAPPYRMMHKLIAGLGVSGGFTVRMINAKHILIQLSKETDFTRLWLRRIWTIQGFPMRIFKWDPTFNPSQESSVVPLWVEFPELPRTSSRKMHSLLWPTWLVLHCNWMTTQLIKQHSLVQRCVSRLT